ncbi:PPPDE putative thiol peptidase family protein [Abeliophyllum distichum]|uniref:PPPDE putative thiol peptidase family protein n=1 Tax=Abeliophyllum distichum TaxID=126358 RepID=A0ABD1RQM4_9LAMI
MPWCHNKPFLSWFDNVYHLRLRLGLGIEQFLVSTLNMKSKLSNSWHSIVPLHVQGESANNFCVFPKVNSASESPRNFPVYLNVYDLTPVNGYFYWAGVGVFHSGVEVHGVEYAFGAHDYPSSGVFEIEPRQCPGFKFRKSILMGTTYLNPNKIKEFMERQTANYNGDTYHLIVKNCNHFCEDICYKLTGNWIPKWVNRLAKIGSFCNCILPEALKSSTVRHGANCQGFGCKKKSRRSSFGSFSSISILRKEREMSISSLFLHSHYKGCLPPWELKTSASKSLKEG